MNNFEEGRRKHSLEIDLDNDLYNYISFLEKIQRIKKKEDAIDSALRIFKKLNMQDWYPNIYRSGQERIIILSQGMLNDLFNTMSEAKLKRTSRMIAMNRISLDTFDQTLDLANPENWGVILNEMENFGWGKFTRKRKRIIVEQLALPILFIKGYLETLFKIKFIMTEEKEEKRYNLSISSA